MRRSPDAEALWEDLYNSIDDEVDGMVGALTARAEAQMLRLSVAYALTDGSAVIDVPHLLAARAVWKYSEETIAYAFGDSMGDEVADRMLVELRPAGDGGLDGSSLSAVFGRHVNAKP